MAAEVVHHQMDGLGFWILQSQMEQDLRELESRPIRGGEGEVASRFRLYGAENIGGATAFILTVLSCFPPRFGRRGRTGVGVQRDRLLVQADYRLRRILWPLIGFQHLLHLVDVLFIEVGHAPHFLPATA